MCIRYSYYCGEKIKDVDLNSFEILPYGFSKDKNSLYFEGEKILENIKNFKFLGGNFFLINDKIYVLFFEEKARILEIDFNTLREVKIDIPTMKILGKNYISDKNNIYYVNNIIEKMCIRDRISAGTEAEKDMEELRNQGPYYLSLIHILICQKM